MLKFPKIGQFKDAIYQVRARSDFAGLDEQGNPIYTPRGDYPTLQYEGSVKLHGTNASIVRNMDGTFSAQSRERVISLESDNNGFARFAFETIGEKFWENLFQQIDADNQKPLAIYGEWCGGNIQHGVAISNLEKMFVIFSVRVGEDEETVWYKPDFIFPDDTTRIYSITDFESYSIDIDFMRPDLSQNQMVELTIAVETKCPVASKLGAEGIGEGIVWRCVTPEFQESKFWFKTKGEKHSASKVKTIAAVDTEKMDSIVEFVDYTVTEVRLLQAIEYLERMSLSLDQKSTSDFLRWIINDIAEEEADTLEASGLEAKEVNKHISHRARNWFFEWIKNSIK